MSPQFDESQAHAWLSMIYGEAEGFINIVSTNNWAGRCFKDIDQAVAYIKLLDRQQAKGIYARATTLRHEPEDKSRGDVDLTCEFVGFWADLDIQGPGHKTDKPLPRTVEDCLAIIETSGLPAPTEWVHSGGGMYPWWLLPQPIKMASSEHLEAFIEHSANWQRVIELASQKLGYHYGAGVGDLTRVLRIPGTVNRKVDDYPTLCDWRIDLSSSRPYGITELTTAMTAASGRLEPPKKTETRPVAGFTPPKTATGTSALRPGDDFNNSTTWHQLLQADGAEIFRDRGIGYIEWTRPGKDRRDGMSATTGYKGSDVLKVFTDMWPNLEQGRTYDRFGYYVATQHGGNMTAATKALAALGYGEQRQAGGWTAPGSVIYGDFAVPIVNTWETAEHLPSFVAEEASQLISREPAVKPNYTFTESGIANRMQLRYGNGWRYVAARQRFGWLKWNGTVWETDKRGAVTDLVDQLVQGEWSKTKDIEDEKVRDQTQRALRPMLSSSKQVGATAVFSRRRQIAIDPDQLDAHPTKITCTNGVLDLATGNFTDHDPQLLATKKLGVAYDPDSKHTAWDRFLEQVLPDPDIRDYLQRAVGYTLLGDPNRKAIFMLHGPSNTGKSQVVNALKAIFGDFAEAAKEQTFRINDSASGPTPGLHKLRGARLVAASESNESVRLDEALIKQLTGGDDVCTRPLYGDEETWQPQFSIWLATNFLPKFNSDDNAIWRRVKPIHFAQVFGTGDRTEILDIGRHLVTDEGSGILNWILEGIAKYRERGLAEPDALMAGVTAYQQESDPVARFITQAISEETLVKDPDAKIEAKILYNAFSAWCADEGIRFPLASSRFGRRMATLGYKSTRTATSRMWQGLSPGKNTFIISQQRWRE